MRRLKTTPFCNLLLAERLGGNTKLNWLSEEITMKRFVQFLALQKELINPHPHPHFQFPVHRTTRNEWIIKVPSHASFDLTFTPYLGVNTWLNRIQNFFP